MFKNLFGGLSLLLLLSSCMFSPHAPNTIAPLVYQVGNEAYTLEKSCVSNISLSHYGDGIWLEVTPSQACAMRFEQFISEHLGEQLKVSFNHHAVTDATLIASPIRLHSGFHQHISQLAEAKNIIAYYQAP